MISEGGLWSSAGEPRSAGVRWHASARGQFHFATEDPEKLLLQRKVENYLRHP